MSGILMKTRDTCTLNAAESEISDIETTDSLCQMF